MMLRRTFFISFSFFSVFLMLRTKNYSACDIRYVFETIIHKSYCVLLRKKNPQEKWREEQREQSIWALAIKNFAYLHHYMPLWCVEWIKKKQWIYTKKWPPWTLILRHLKQSNFDSIRFSFSYAKSDFIASTQFRWNFLKIFSTKKHDYWYFWLNRIDGAYSSICIWKVNMDLASIQRHFFEFHWISVTFCHIINVSDSSTKITCKQIKIVKSTFSIC